MGPIVIDYHVNSIGSEFNWDQRGMNEFVQIGHNGLVTWLYCMHITTICGNAT